MKKFLALLFVSAALTSMAAVPHVNTAKMDEGKAQKAMVLKSNTLANQFTAPVMQGQKNVMSVQKFFAERNLTPNDNLMMRKAPRRVTEDNVLAEKLVFLVAYDLNDSGALVLTGNYCQGGWDGSLEKIGDNKYNSFMYFTGIPFVIDVDYANKTVEMEAGELLSGFEADTTTSGKTTTITETEYFVELLNADALFEEDGDLYANLQGSLYEDGTISIPGGWVVFETDYQKIRTIRNGSENVTYDTVAGRVTDFIYNTYLMTPNGLHTYTATNSQGAGDTYNKKVYMFQDADTAYVWNLYQFGYRGVEININEDGTMNLYPQVVGTGDIEDLQSAYAAYDWSDGYEFWNLDTIVGTVEADAIKWDSMTWQRWAGLNGSWYTLSYYPMINNVLNFTDGDFFMVGTTADPVINYDVTDEAVVITLEVEEGAQYLMTVNGEYVESPYTIARTEEDQTVTVMAIAQAYGKHESNVVQTEILIPALEGGMPGDVDDNGIVNITDVTTLISAVMSENFSTINADNADMNGDGTINVTDVTLLISMVMAQ